MSIMKAVITLSVMLIQDIYFFDVNTNYILSNVVLKISVISQVRIYRKNIFIFSVKGTSRANYRYVSSEVWRHLLYLTCLRSLVKYQTRIPFQIFSGEN